MLAVVRSSLCQGQALLGCKDPGAAAPQPIQEECPAGNVPFTCVQDLQDCGHRGMPR